MLASMNEIGYGLSYPDAAGRFIELDHFKEFVKNSIEQKEPVILFISQDRYNDLLKADLLPEPSTGWVMPAKTERGYAIIRYG